MPAWRYRPELDGLRAIAVYLVLLFHAQLASVEGGFIGVDLFFVLSGFLVSQVILREVDERGTFAVGGFYARRVRRLLPAAVVVIVSTALLQVLVTSLPLRVEMVDDARASLLYYANWHFIAESRDYFAAAGDASPYLHFWSLSIEEQFYIGFPLVLIAAIRVSRRPERLIAVFLAAVLVVSVALQVWLARGDADYAYYSTQTRLYQLVAGILLALAVRRFAARPAPPTPTTPPGVARLAAPVGVLGLLLVGSGLLELSPSNRGLAATAAAVLTIAGLSVAPAGLTGRALALPIPRYLGQISYGTYLWHWPILLLLQQLFDVSPLMIAALGGLVSTALAALSYQLLETPIRRTKRFDRRRWATVAVGLGVSVLAAALVVPQVLDAPRRPALTAGTEGPAAAGADEQRLLEEPVPADLDLVAAKDDISPGQDLCTTAAPTACVLATGDGPSVVVVGDSQAQMFLDAFRALAKDHDLTLSAGVLKACMWQEGLQNELSRPDEQAKCRTAREDFYRDVLPGLHADVVVAISMAHAAPRWEQDLTAPGGPAGESLEGRQLRTTRETADTIEAAGADLVLVKSVLGTESFDLDGFDPLDCLAKAGRLGDCAVVPPLGRPAIDGMYDTLALDRPGVSTVDFNPVICVGTSVCSPVVKGQVVWKDPDHVTASYLVEHRDELWTRLLATGAFD